MKSAASFFANLTLFAAIASAAESELTWRSNVTSPRITLLEKQLRSGDSQASARFWAGIKDKGAPLVEPVPGDPTHVLLTFLYRANIATEAVVLNAQLIKTRDESLKLTRLLQSDVWSKTFWIRNDMRFSYSLNSARDPLNPKSLPEGSNPGQSLVELPGAAPQPWIIRKQRAPAGLLTEASFPSKILNAKRSAWIYTPPGYDAKRATPYPVLICFDGLLYASDEAIPTPKILDNLIAAKAIPPMMAIFVVQSPQPQRNLELSNNGPFADFVANELLPQVRQQWRVTSAADQTIVCGSSAGGLAALFFAFHRPDVFGNVLAQSAALWPGKERDNPQHEWLTEQFRSAPKLAVRIVLQPGLLEVVQTPLNGPSILDANRHLRDVLIAKGYTLYYSEAAGGHEPVTWRGGMAPGLIQLMGKLDHPPVDAVTGIVAAFEKHPVVIIGESRHWVQQMGDLYIRLVNDRSFQNAVQDIVIEFGSRQNQRLIDRYVGGESVPMDEVRHIWRDTAKVASWEAPMYAAWLAAIREVNGKLPRGRRFRVLASDTAVDWSRMKTREDWAALGDNNVSIADVIVTEVLKKKHHALVVLGSNHVTKSGDRSGGPNTTTRVETYQPGSTYVAMLCFPNNPNEDLLRLPDPHAPALYDLAGTKLGNDPDTNGTPPQRYTDAWLYVGPQAALTQSEPAPGSLEPAYVKEIDRRSMIEWGELRARKFLGAAMVAR